MGQLAHESVCRKKTHKKLRNEKTQRGIRIAVNYRIHVYTLDAMSSPFKDPVRTLASPQALNTGGGPESPHIINAIKVGNMLGREILVSVSEWGEVCVWETENLDKPPIILRNEHKTWGIAIHGEQGLLAVSANNWKIKIYNLAEMTKNDPSYTPRKALNVLNDAKEVILEGHEHNIPCIDFNETGEYLASASIDATTKVWDIRSKQIVTYHRRPAIRNQEQDTWCWSTKFIKPGHFKYITCTDTKINKRFMQRLDQGRSTSLANLNLCHSANAPIYPTMDIGRILDLNADDIEDEILEEEINDDLWDNSLIRQEESVVADYILQQRERLSSASAISSNTVSGDEERDAWNEPVQGVEEIPMGYRPHSQLENSYGQILQSILRTRLEHGEFVESQSPSSSSMISPTEEGWDDTDEDETTTWEATHTEGMEEEIYDEEEEMCPGYCIPKIIQNLDNNANRRKANQPNELDEYLMLSTAKDIVLMRTTLPKMTKVRQESDIISKVDVRADRLLYLLDRITMVEWIPELELFVTASQKGTVALTRILQLELEDGRQTCVFNNEYYLPIDVLQTTPLYGMTVKKVVGERFSPVVYQIFLFYFGGNVLGYNISRKDSNITVTNLAYL
ncbi:WD40 repeat-like protein [Rhizopus microsporus ATCC 52813]|uniref:WD40 repeat-like protein n=1 Tax=Rhizopus microsporus ATCC 52813 TaxID=1340429 RepID=A0A2G4SJD2_RHIZD|nr:WD40 repeat-like protein [Rhizopus microsporus ATCC 52813]PHZ08887.1 WD40 repeat-like protein [Rhizopus microsporus ATCC 52813]